MAAEKREPLVAHLLARDFDRLATDLSPAVLMRILTPSRSGELHGREAVVGQFRSWFGNAVDVHPPDGDIGAAGPRRRLSWRLCVSRDGGPPEAIEQVAFVDTGEAGVERIDLLCSGFAPVDAVTGAATEFDAGPLGCADGLAQEFRRQIESVPVGGALRVVATDPAAREDLPALARMLGHTVRRSAVRPDGRLEITVERGR